MGFYGFVFFLIVKQWLNTAASSGYGRWPDSCRACPSDSITGVVNGIVLMDVQTGARLYWKGD